MQSSILRCLFATTTFTSLVFSSAIFASATEITPKVAVFTFAADGMDVKKPNNVNSLCAYLGYDEAAKNDTPDQPLLKGESGDKLLWVVCVKK